MQTRRRALAVATAGLTAVALALTGCSGDSGGGSDDGSLEVFSYLTSGAEAEALQTLFDQYTEANPGTSVENAAVSGGGGSSAAQVLQSRIAGNDAPAVWQAHPGAALQVFAEAGLVEDLTPVFEEEGWMDAYPQEMLDSLSYKGKIYGVPFSIAIMNLVWYNKDLAAQLGLTIGDSLTWDDMVAGMDAAKAQGIDPVCLGDKDVFTTSEIAESSILAQLGTDDYRAVLDGDIGWDDPRIQQGLENYKVIYDNANADHNALTWDQSAKKFSEGTCLFLPLVDSAYGELQKTDMVDGVNYGTVPFPGTDTSVLSVSDLFVVSSALDDNTDALNFVRAVGTAEAGVTYQKIKGNIPVRLDSDVSSLGEYQKKFFQQYQTATVFGSLTFGEAAAPAIQQAFYDAVVQFNSDGDVDRFADAMAAAKG